MIIDFLMLPVFFLFTAFLLLPWLTAVAWYSVVCFFVLLTIALVRELSGKPHTGPEGVFTETFKNMCQLLKESRRPAIILTPLALVGGIAFAVVLKHEDDTRHAKMFQDEYKQAVKGDAQAQWLLGRDYLAGDGVEPDAAEAARWIEKSANQGLEEAQNDLGKLYLEGRGVKKDAVTAAKWYRKAVNQGNPFAADALSDMYRDGTGVKKDIREAVFWLAVGAPNPSVFDEPSSWRDELDALAQPLTKKEVEDIRARAWKWKGAHPRKYIPNILE